MNLDSSKSARPASTSTEVCILPPVDEQLYKTIEEVRFVHCLNQYNDGIGEPTIGFFIDWGAVNDTDELEFRLPNMKKAILCHIRADEDDNKRRVYYLSCNPGKFNIAEENPTKFVAKFVKYFKLKITLFDAWQYFRVTNGDQDLHAIFTAHKSRINNSILDILLGTNHVWDVHHDFDFNTKRYVFECKTELSPEKILESLIVDSKVKQILESDFVHLKHQIASKDDKLELESTPNDICSGVGIWSPISRELIGTVGLFMHKGSVDQVHHYCLTACHAIVTEKDPNRHYKISHKFSWVSDQLFSEEKPVRIPGDAVALRVDGRFTCRFLNLNCLALKECVSSEVSTNFEIESSAQESSSSQDDTTDHLFDDNVQIPIDIRQHANPGHVEAQYIKLLKEKYNSENQRLPIYKYGAKTDLTVGFVGRIDCSTRLGETDHKNMIEVQWLEGIDFARPGDSGSLYYIYSNTHEFVPVAIHAGSKTKSRLSYGTLIHEIFDQFRKNGQEFFLCSSLTCR